MYVYEPELVENFLERHNLVQQFARPIKNNIPEETIGDLINYRAAMFWLEVIMNETTPEEWGAFIWFFNKLADSRRLEQWSLYIFKFIVNEIYGQPIFFGVPFTDMVNKRLAHLANN